MCGRYTLTSSTLVDELELARGEPTDAASEWWRPRWNIAPTQPAPVVIQHRDGERVVELMRWGLVPHWADDLKIGARMINARVEGILTKPGFRDVIRRRRCLVPADGFFDRRAIGGGAAPTHPARAAPADHVRRRVVEVAREAARSPLVVESYSILTCRPARWCGRSTIGCPWSCRQSTARRGSIAAWKTPRRSRR